MPQMERDLDTKLDWVAVDHFNTGHPHTHIVIRGRDDRGQDLVMARDYIGHGVRARAQDLITLELGPETEVERVAEALQRGRPGAADPARPRSLIARAKDGILVVTAAEERDPAQQTLAGRPAQDPGAARARRRSGSRACGQLDAELESKLRQLGERADKFKMMQRALKEAGIDRGAAGMALFERGPRKAPLIGKVVGVGLVDEITDRTWVVVDAVDGRVHYAELGRLKPDNVPARDSIVRITADRLDGKPQSAPRLQILSRDGVDRLAAYDGPVWLDRLATMPDASMQAARGFGAELSRAVAERRQWLAAQDWACAGRRWVRDARLSIRTASST